MEQLGGVKKILSRDNNIIMVPQAAIMNFAIKLIIAW